MDNKTVVIIGGGTVYHVRNHLALCAPAYGTTARKLYELSKFWFDKMTIDLYLTKMAAGGDARGRPLETNEDIDKLVQELVENDTTKVIFMTAALCDYTGEVGGLKSGKYVTRLKSADGVRAMTMVPATKIIGNIRKNRKDIFLVGFKTTCGASEDEQYIAGLNLCKQASCNLVLVNDTKTRLNMVVSPEEARYHVTTNRDEVLAGLVQMTKDRSHLTFTRSTVVKGDPVPWDSPMVPDGLRKVVDHCIERGAYKPFRGSTAGHFACKLNDTTFLTSIRKTDFNNLHKTGLVLIETDGPDTVLAYGAKPSVGGQSQRIVFKDHPGFDCILHFHCPIKPGSEVPQVSQREFECGSHECGQNTSNGLKRFTIGCDNIWAVYLKEHGPNILFHHDVNVRLLTDFIEANFDLDQKTGGFVSIRSRLETPNTLEVAKQIL